MGQRSATSTALLRKVGLYNRSEFLIFGGLIVPGRDGVTHSCDTGWWGKGIYISPFHTYSMGYMYGGSKGLFLCT